MVDLRPFAANIDAAIRESKRFDVSDNPRDDFYQAMINDGYHPSENQIILNKLIRIGDPDDKPHKKTGWYWYSEFEMTGYVLGVGTYGSWRNADKITWSSKSQGRMSAEEAFNYRAKIEQAKSAREAEQEIIYGEAAIEAARIYNSARMPDVNHGYLTKKHIKPSETTRQVENALIIPLLNDGGEITSIQRIFPDGFKKNLTGGKMKGSFHFINGSDCLICICEGYATGASINEATGASVYCAMSAHNIYETASIAKKYHPTADIVVCADDNSANKINTGLNAATQAAETFGLRVASPTVKKDFNDMLCATSAKEVNSLIFPTFKKADPKPKQEIKHEDEKPPVGFLRDVYDYYNATSGNDQKGFAVQTAIALGSVLLGRRFKTDNNNFSSLFLLNIGKSATGKEHAKTVIYKILKNANKLELMGGSNYTSEGAVVSAASRYPKHISICDEFGRNIQAGKNSKDVNFSGANSKLMESIGSCATFMRGRNYSTMGLAKDKADELNKVIEMPAITLLAMSTPSTFFESIDHKAIMDGFIGRFIISVSDAKRERRKRVADLPIPESIISWINAVYTRSKSDLIPDVSNEVPHVVTIHIKDDAYAWYQENVEDYFIEQANKLEDYKMDDANNRSAEFVLRLSLICALSCDPKTEAVEIEHMQWAADYVKKSMSRVIADFKHFVSGSEFEAKKKEALDEIRKAGKHGISLKNMNKQQPFSKWQLKDRKDVLSALVEAELVFFETTSTTGRPSTNYFAIGD